MSDPSFLPGGRDARGTLDEATGRDATACVVACPPHPQHGGTRRDQRLRAVSDALCDRGIDCLRFDYGPWDGGRGERTDVGNAVAWARKRYDRVALFGFSFGGALALSAAAAGADVDAVSALAPPARLGSERSDPDAPDEEGIGGVDVVADLEALSSDLPVQVVYGTRDDVAHVGPVVDAARERGFAVVEFPADHFFVGQESKVAGTVSDFLAPYLQEVDSS
ncbi:alpha/beta hydrolase [Halobellus rufus]|uniref:alpha/beta hydrolase n=1 Tax=Halobellus rufus TaxID=1448860 RepID=UPI000678A321|nr:alpha/beta hydrolase [Halobellus rufus]